MLSMNRHVIPFLFYKHRRDWYNHYHASKSKGLDDPGALGFYSPFGEDDACSVFSLGLHISTFSAVSADVGEFVLFMFNASAPGSGEWLHAQAP